MAQPQLLENVWQVYHRIIDETLKASTPAQSTAVLEQLKKRWVAHLNERIRADDSEQQKGPALDQSATNVSRGILKGAKLKVGGTPTDGTKTSMSMAGVGGSLVQHAKMAPNVHTDAMSMGRLPWAVADTPPPSAVIQTNPWATQAAETETETGDRKGEETSVVVEVSESAAQEEDEEDDWGEWESAEKIVAAVEEQRQETAVPNVIERHETLPQPVVETPLVPAEGYTDMEGNYVPTEADFATRVRTQYGRSQGAGDVVTAGQSAAWTGSEDPDAIDSDLDNVPDFDDDEPHARDVIVAQVETVTRPPGRKAQSQGLWKIKARNGVARIDGQEIFFDTLYADLEF